MVLRRMLASGFTGALITYAAIATVTEAASLLKPTAVGGSHHQELVAVKTVPGPTVAGVSFAPRDIGVISVNA